MMITAHINSETENKLRKLAGLQDKSLETLAAEALEDWAATVGEARVECATEALLFHNPIANA